MSFLNTYDLAKSISFRARLVSGIVKVAGAVMAEDIGDKSQAWFQKRQTLAMTILRNPEAVVDSFIWPVLSNVSIAAAGLDASDGDLEYQINQVWDTLGGVAAEDKVSP